jgi:hypothetical protein
MRSPNPDYSSLDDALALLASAGPDLKNGMSNHAPMAVEAMCALGRTDAISPWLNRYREGLAPRPPADGRITEADWRAALGGGRRTGDWFPFFRNELEDHPWRDVLDRWAQRLAPGIVSAAMHGVIRTGHAVRAIGIRETPERRRELADGLAYWAAEYQSLPGDRRTPARAMPSAAIARVPMIPPAERGRFDSLTGALGQLDTFEPFATTLAAVDPTDPVAFLSDLTTTFARVYLANAHDWLTAIAFVHAVTGPSALRPMLPHLQPETARTTLAYVWQASAALYATFGAEPGTPRVEPGEAPTFERLVDCAIASGDEHAIKFTEACLREHAIGREPAFLSAAERAIGMLDRTYPGSGRTSPC